MSFPFLSCLGSCQGARQVLKMHRIVWWLGGGITFWQLQQTGGLGSAISSA
jgi:hypothetical protein